MVDVTFWDNPMSTAQLYYELAVIDDEVGGWIDYIIIV